MQKNASSKKTLGIEFLGFEDLKPTFGSRRSIYDQIKSGRLPQPLNPYGNRRMWPKSEIMAIQRGILLGYSPKELKKLVIEITEKRKELADSLIATSLIQA